LGHKQAEKVAEFLASESVDHVLCSPYLRTIQTADRISDKLGKLVKVESGLWETKHGIELASVRERVRYYPRIDSFYEPKHTPVVPERFEDIFPRSNAVVQALLTAYPDENLVLVTHAAPAIAFAAAFLTNGRVLSEEDTRPLAPLGPCGVYRLERSGSGPWSLAMNAHHEHLGGLVGATTPWHFLM
jgi:broad specificity phosphatase PhoE